MNSENILEVNILDEKIAVFTLTNPNRRKDRIEGKRKKKNK